MECRWRITNSVQFSHLILFVLFSICLQLLFICFPINFSFQTRWISRKQLRLIQISNRFDLLLSLNGAEGLLTKKKIIELEKSTLNVFLLSMLIGCIDVSDLRNGQILQRIRITSTNMKISSLCHCELTSTIFIGTSNGTVHGYKN
jgi:hypothetical protein